MAVLIRVTAASEEHADDGDAVIVCRDDLPERAAVPLYTGYTGQRRPCTRGRVGGRWRDATVYHKIHPSSGSHLSRLETGRRRLWGVGRPIPCPGSREGQ
jgi:hypothetical protein